MIIDGLYAADEIRRLRVEKECMPPPPGNPLHSPAQGLTDGLRPPLSPGTPGPLPRGGGRQGVRGYTYLQKVLGGGSFGLVLKVRDCTGGQNTLRAFRRARHVRHHVRHRYHPHHHLLVMTRNVHYFHHTCGNAGGLVKIKA